jgi:hypothetical protein
MPSALKLKLFVYTTGAVRSAPLTQHNGYIREIRYERS